MNDADGIVVLPAALGSELLVASFALRTEVFVDEQGVPAELELDEYDGLTTTRHLVIPMDPEAVPGPLAASVRWIVEPAGHGGADPAWGSLAHLQRLVVHRSARGTGLGVRLVEAVEDDASAAQLSAVVLSAQLQALGFYERLGYTAHGPVFDDAGIPHRWMTKALVADTP